MKNGISRRLFSLALALMMSLSFFAPVSRAEEPEELPAEEEPAQEYYIFGETEPEITLLPEDTAEDAAEPDEEEFVVFELEEPSEELYLAPGIRDQGTCGDALTWVLDTDGVLTISGSGAMTDYQNNAPWSAYYYDIFSVVIEDGVESIGDDAFLARSYLTSVTIGKDVKSIGDCAFYNCISLESVVIPDGVISIGERAFYSCDYLRSAVIPDTVSTLGKYVFEGCKSLEEVNIPKGISALPRGMFMSCESLKEITVPDSVTSVGEDVFNGCGSLETVSLPGSVASIWMRAFEGCTGLKTVVYRGTLSQWNSINKTGNKEILLNAELIYALGCGTFGAEGDNLSWILFCDGRMVISGSGAMKNYSYIISDRHPEWESLCDSIETVEICDGVTNVGKYAFEGCANIKSLFLADSVTAIEYAAFDGCSSLSALQLPGSLASLDSTAFIRCPSLGSISVDSANTVYFADGNCLIENGTGIVVLGCKSSVIPSYVSTIGEAAFCGCRNMQAVTIPNSVTEIKERAFEGCWKLTEVNLPWNLQSIGASAFYDCRLLKHILIPDTVSSLGNSAFRNCADLESIAIPSNLHELASSVFQGCSKLKRVIFPVEVTKVGYSTFSGCEALANGDVFYTGWVQDWNVINIQSGNEALENATRHYPADPDSWGISNDIIWWISSDGTLLLTGDGVMEDFEVDYEIIPPHAEQPWYDYNQSIVNVIVDYGVKNIGAYAFSDLRNVQTVSIADSVESIGRAAFFECRSLTELVIPSGVSVIPRDMCVGCNNLQNVVFSEGVTHICREVFGFGGSIALKTVTIPVSMTDIDEYAFSACTGLEAVYYAGTDEQWDKIYIGKYNDPIMNKSIRKNIIASGKCGNNITWTLNADGMLEIEGGMYSVEEFYDYRKPAQTPWAPYADHITSLKSDDSLILQEGLFRDLHNLTEAELYDVTDFPDELFSGCESLTDVKFAVTYNTFSVGRKVFNGCISLTDIWYLGTKNSWDSFQKNIDNQQLADVTVHFAEAGVLSPIFPAQTLNSALSTAAGLVEDGTYGDYIYVYLYGDLDYSGETIVVPPGVVLDLCGYTLAADALLVFGAVADDTEEYDSGSGEYVQGTGALKIPQNAFVYTGAGKALAAGEAGWEQNAQLPYRDDECFRFASITRFGSKWSQDLNAQGQSKFIFYPLIYNWTNTFWKTVLGEDSGVGIYIRATIKTEKDTLVYDFVYTRELMTAWANGIDSTGCGTFILKAKADDTIQSITVQPFVKSSYAGIVIYGEEKTTPAT